MVSRKCPTHSSLRLGLEPRLGLGLSLSLWDRWVAISRKCPTHSSLRLELELESNLGLVLSLSLWEGWVGGF